MKRFEPQRTLRTLRRNIINLCVLRVLCGENIKKTLCVLRVLCGVTITAFSAVKQSR